MNKLGNKMTTLLFEDNKKISKGNSTINYELIISAKDKEIDDLTNKLFSSEDSLIELRTRIKELENEIIGHKQVILELKNDKNKALTNIIEHINKLKSLE